MEQLETDAQAWLLTPTQQAMLFLTLAMPEAGYYVHQVICTLDETLDVVRFRRAWEVIAERHAILRTRVQWGPGTPPRQLVRPHAGIPLEQMDAAGLMPEQRAQRLEEFLAGDRRRGIAPDQPPLWRLTLLRWSAGAWTCVWTFHHLLLDGRSRCRVIEEVFAAYDRPDVAAPPPSRTFRSYADWLSQQNNAPSEAFWKQQLEHFPGAFGLPARSGGAEISPEPGLHGRQQLEVDAETTQRLRSLAKSHGVTLNNLVQGAWALALGRYNGVDEVVLGAIRACRHWGDQSADDSVGLLINTVPFRVRIAPDLPLSGWLRGLREQQVALRPHGHAALSQIRQWTGLPGDAPLFRTLLAFENFHPEERLARLGNGRRFELREKPDTVTLSAYAGQTLLLTLEYECAQYADADIRRVLAHLRQLLLAMLAATAEDRLGDLEMITPEELGLMRGFWQGPRVPYSDDPRAQCAHDLFEAQAGRTPEAIAVVFEGRQLTYRELNARSNQLAHYLIRQGVGPEVLVGLCVERALEMVVALLGIHKAGGAYVPIDPNYPQERKRFMVADAQVSVLLTQRELAGRLPLPAKQTILLDEDWDRIALESGAHVAGGATGDNLVYVIYTSGSTGNPKGVQITHRALVNALLAIRQQSGLMERDRLLAVTTLSFDIAGLEIYLPLLVGACVEVVSHEVAVDGARLLECLTHSGATVMQATPVTWRMLVEAGWQGTLGLKVLCGGETMSRDLADQLLERVDSLWNLYGPTETTIYSTSHRVRSDAGPVPIGHPIANTRVYLLDRNQHLVPMGVAGEIYIGGDGVARGYLNRADLTQERFLPDPFRAEAGAQVYRTGDWGRYREDGDIEFLGRMDDQVKIRGVRIELGEIEAVVRQQRGVKEAVVMARGDQRGDKRLVAYVIFEGDATLSTEELRRLVGQKLPGYMVPGVFVAVEKLPLTANGKVDRKALPASEGVRQELTREHVGPRTMGEQSLLQLWEQVLGVKGMGMHDDFFALGGHSLTAMQLVAQIRNSLHAEVPLRVIFERPTIEGQALYVLEQQARSAAGDLGALLDEVEQLRGAVAVPDMASPSFSDPQTPASNVLRIDGDGSA